MPQHLSYACFANALAHADAQWLVKAFFTHYATELCQEKMGLSNPLDALFLTEAVLDNIAWEHQPGCGLAWRHAAEAALQSLGLDTRYAVLKQRFPQTLASAGVSEAGKQMLSQGRQLQARSVSETCTTWPCGPCLCSSACVHRHMLQWAVEACHGAGLYLVQARSQDGDGACSHRLHPYATNACRVTSRAYAECGPIQLLY